VIGPKPQFMKSPHWDMVNCRLSDDAPEHLKKAFRKWKQDREDWYRRGDAVIEEAHKARAAQSLP